MYQGYHSRTTTSWAGSEVEGEGRRLEPAINRLNLPLDSLLTVRSPEIDGWHATGITLIYRVVHRHADNRAVEYRRHRSSADPRRSKARLYESCSTYFQKRDSYVIAR